MTKENLTKGIEEILKNNGIDYKKDETGDLRITNGELVHFISFYERSFSVSTWIGDVQLSAIYPFYEDVQQIHEDEDNIFFSFGISFATINLKAQG